MKETLFKAVDGLFPKYLQIWQDICNLESPTGHKAGVDAVGEYFLCLARSLGWNAEICPQAVSGNALCLTMNPDSPLPPVVFSGHMDTVHPLGLFGSPAVRIEGDYLSGPGVADCKGGLAAACLAMEALMQCQCGRRILLLLQSDEETSSRSSDQATIRFMADQAKGCTAFLNLEASAENRTTLSRKGILKYEFTIAGKAAHAGSCTKGVSAIAEAAQKILLIEARKDVPNITANVGTISGGTATNTVPAECSFTVDFRFRNPGQEAEVRRFVQEVADTVHIPGTSCQVKLLSRRCSMPETEPNIALLHHINEILKGQSMHPLEPVFGFGGSDAANMTEYGIPCLDCFGVSGGGLHTCHERAVISSLPRSAKLLALLGWYL